MMFYSSNTATVPYYSLFCAKKAKAVLDIKVSKRNPEPNTMTTYIHA
jgi:hypothetical protein